MINHTHANIMKQKMKKDLLFEVGDKMINFNPDVSKGKEIPINF